MPILLPLAAGRIVFFYVIDVAMAVRQIVLEIHDMPLPRAARARLLPFWVAWVMAVSLLAGGLAGVVMVVSRTGQWQLSDQWVTRGAAIALALFAFYLAFRLALVGTAALQRVLAHNLALLVSFELTELKAEAIERAEILAAGGNSPAFRLPFFREEREDIAKLLGQPTEEALQQLLVSLEAFNNATVTDDRSQAAMHMRTQLADVDLQLRRAFSAVDPFCRHPA
ncbi:MAG: hypothetical protein HYU58_17860 [Proteobacteria bacterium]|nr:hypothetical protein [Pseudomonadota bacterium]